MKKVFLSFAVIMTIVCSMCACGNSTPSNTSDSDSDSIAVNVVDTTDTVEVIVLDSTVCND